MEEKIEQELIDENSIKQEVVEDENNNDSTNLPDENQKNVFDIFAWIGFFSGLAVLLISFFGFGVFVFWIGIVLSCIGKKSIKNRKMADYGLLFSIFSLVITLALFLFTN
ncbi:MAG: hypothetical protein IJP63_06020 [Acholeplasmatales bacterium]|nr:hypothetical protein [Acholeplasmatales bacterium]